MTDVEPLALRSSSVLVIRFVVHHIKGQGDITLVLVVFVVVCLMDVCTLSMLCTCGEHKEEWSSVPG